MDPHVSYIPWSRNDDWRGLSNPLKRRRIQNRLNQRARRTRHRSQSTPISTDAASINTHSEVIPQSPWRRLSTSTPHEEVKRVVEAISILDLHSAENKSVVAAFEAFMYHNWLAHAPRPELLPSLAQFNFIKALLSNASLLDLTDRRMKDDDALSEFSIAGPLRSSAREVKALPPGLQPTELQIFTAHHPWFDLIPVPQMRDNLFRRGVDNFNDEELCRSMRGRGDRGSAGFLVWKEPWDSSGWEVTEVFARSSWAWTIAGCVELCKSTNTWRARRGESPLFHNT